MKKLKRFEFKPSNTSKYPWDAILNGDINQLAKGDDYQVETDAMGPKIRTAARRRYKLVKISFKDADGNKLDNALIVQAIDMTPEQRVEEDAKRAVEKEARKAAGEAEEAPEEAEAAA